MARRPGLWVPANFFSQEPCPLTHEGRGGGHVGVQPHVAVTKLSVAAACTFPGGSQPPWRTPSVIVNSPSCAFGLAVPACALPPAPLSTNSEDARGGGRPAQHCLSKVLLHRRHEAEAGICGPHTLGPPNPWPDGMVAWPVEDPAMGPAWRQHPCESGCRKRRVEPRIQCPGAIGCVWVRASHSW